MNEMKRYNVIGSMGQRFIELRRIISSGDGITITAITVTKQIETVLSTNGARLPEICRESAKNAFNDYLAPVMLVLKTIRGWFRR